MKYLANFSFISHLSMAPLIKKPSSSYIKLAILSLSSLFKNDPHKNKDYFLPLKLYIITYYLITVLKYLEIGLLVYF